MREPEVCAAGRLRPSLEALVQVMTCFVHRGRRVRPASGELQLPDADLYEAC